MESIVNIDVIILSYAKDKALEAVTRDGIKSLLQSEPSGPVKFNIVVIESNRNLFPYQYAGTTTIYPEEAFGYNRYINMGLKISSSPYVCIANNDLVYHKDWATEIMKCFQQDPLLSSASPACSVHHPLHGIPLNSGAYYGYDVRKEVSGWCIVFKRSILDTIGRFDEKFRFWYADDDYAKTLKRYDLKHALVSSSIVDHLESQTLKTHTPKTQYVLQRREKYYYEYKWGQRSYLSYLIKKLKFIGAK